MLSPKILLRGSALATIAVLTGLATGSDEAWAACSPAGPYSGAADTVICNAVNPGAGETINTLGGADTFRMSVGTIGSLNQGAGADRAFISDGTITGLFDAGDYVEFSGGSIGSVELEAGNNILTMWGNAHIEGTLNSEQGADTLNLFGGTIGGTISTGSNNDNVTIGGVPVQFDGVSITVPPGATAITGNVILEGGNDQLLMNDGSVGGSVYLDAGPANSNAVGADTFNDTATLTGGTISGSVYADSVSPLQTGADTINLAGATVAGSIFAYAGNDIFVWTAGTMTGFEGGEGSDTATVTAASYTGAQVLDGGDDAGVGDGWIDTLTLRGLTVSAPGANLRNWENIIIDGGTVAISGALTTGSAAGTGLTVQNGGAANFLGGLALTGNLTNNGTVSSQDGAVGDVTSVSGNYSGGGVYLVDVDFAADTADTLTIAGNASGVTTIRVVDVSGAAATGNDVRVVTVGGTTGAFVLDGGTIVSGAFNYGLQLAGQEWLLVANLLAQAPLAEAYPQALLAMMSLPTMQQRIGNRWDWPEGDARSSVPDSGGTAIWSRFETSRSHLEPAASTSGITSLDQPQWRMQVGADALLRAWDNGSRLIAGVTAHFGGTDIAMRSSADDGSIDALDHGVGATLTWLGAGGAYVDLQAMASWSRADIDSQTAGAVIGDNAGSGQALSVEIGQKVDMGSQWSVTPQAQLVHASVDFETFTGPSGEVVSLKDADSLKLRLGLALDRDVSWAGSDGHAQRSHVYTIANVIREFSPETSVDVSGTRLSNRRDAWTGELGFGFTRNFDDDRASVYGEANAATGLEAIGKSYRLGGEVGMRLRF